MIDYKNLKLYLDNRFCSAELLRVYWLYEQQVTYGDHLVSRLNGYVKNWIRWAKTGIGKVYLPSTILTLINLNLNKIFACPSQRAKICISNDVCLV